jgi:hypothetical protein
LKQSVATPHVTPPRAPIVSEELISLSLPFRTLFQQAIDTTKQEIQERNIASHLKSKGSSPLKVKAIDNLRYENFTDSDKRAVAWKFFSNLEVKFLIHTLLEK